MHIFYHSKGRKCGRNKKKGFFQLFQHLLKVFVKTQFPHFFPHNFPLKLSIFRGLCTPKTGQFFIGTPSDSICLSYIRCFFCKVSVRCHRCCRTEKIDRRLLGGLP